MTFKKGDRVWHAEFGQGTVDAIAVSSRARVVFDGQLGGHDVLVGDIDGDGDLDLAGKVWSPWKGNANGGRAHADWLENLAR